MFVVSVLSRFALALIVVLAAAGCSATKARDGVPAGLHHDEATMHDEHELGGPVTVTTPALQRMYEFHGHLGPYVVLGYRAGMLARELLRSPGYFDLTADVTSPLETPRSCFIDGIQLGAGCTVGKRNLSVTAGEPVACRFKSKQGGAVRIALADGLPARIHAWIETEGVEATGRKVFEMPHEELFTVE